ncbi:MAG: di-trans,poly-cis-decaprenylcistransferase [Dehalococcoidia bacterium]|nr:di-trans,poly-cis-decaprenylcistransferase [Dehalococcoidia bacterium]
MPGTAVWKAHKWSTFAHPARSLLYKWYTRQLLTQVMAHQVPKHMAMILDGNRRFARQFGFLDVSEGHRFGGQKVTEVIEWCDELNISVVTLWALSTDNLERPPEELKKIYDIVSDRLEAFSNESTNKLHRRRIRVLGRTELLPTELQAQIKKAEETTATWGPRHLNIALAYGGRDEILDGLRRMLRARAASGESAQSIADSLCVDDLQNYLYTTDIPEPELIIRTSGEVRLSGFLLWQSVYSELYFCDALWPMFRKLDFLRAIRSFQARKRRFGR